MITRNSTIIEVAKLCDMKITVGIVDDHQLFVKSLSVLINSFENCQVVVDGISGEEIINKLLRLQTLPDLILLDVSMPGMDGIEVAKLISEKYPSIKLCALSSKDDDYTIINMIKAGCSAYLLKDTHPDELEKALSEIDAKGFYNGDVSNINYRRLIKKAQEEDEFLISAREKAFLQLACSDLTYKAIASKMNLAERTIDGYRESLFLKMNVQSRVGMVMEAIKKGIFVI